MAGLAGVLVVGIVVLANVAGGSAPGPGPFVFFALLAPALAVLGLWQHRRRQAALRAWAAGTGWSYSAVEPGLEDRWRGQPFGQGSRRRGTEVLRGTFESMPALSFTYQWTTGSGKSTENHRAHVVAVALPAYLPTVELTPDGLGAKLAKLVGAQDIRFESEAFNAAWRVTGSDPRVAHDIVHPRLMERLLRADARGSSLRVEGTWVLSWEQGATSVDRIAPRLGLLTAVARAVPRHVWLDHGHDPLSLGSPGPTPPGGPS